MSKTDDLRAAIEAIPARTLASKLRPLMPAIELRLQAGVHLREIVDTLNQSAALGAEMKFATLKSYLQRHSARERAEGRQRVLASDAARAPPPTAPATAADVSDTFAMLRKLRSKPIDLEALAEIGRSTFKKKGI